MNYWLFVTTPANWNVIKKKKIVGTPKSRAGPFSKVSKGDQCLVYIKREPKASKRSEPAITGVFEVISSNYDDERIFDAPPTRPNETFPLRINLRSVTPSADPVPFKPLIPQLSFITDRKNWGRVLQGRAILPISENDFRTVISSLQKG
jgi:predicted RNA-binding protein